MFTQDCILHIKINNKDFRVHTRRPLVIYFIIYTSTERERDAVFATSEYKIIFTPVIAPGLNFDSNDI